MVSEPQSKWRSEDLSPPYIDVPTNRDTEFDPPAEYAELQRKQEIAPIEFHAGHSGWLVTGYDLARKVLSDKRFSVRPDRAHGAGAGTLYGYSGPGLFHLEDPPEHTRLRRSVTSEFTPAKITGWEKSVTALAEACVDRFLKENTSSKGDIVSGFAVPYPALVMADYLGMPKSAQDLLLHTTRRRAGSQNPGVLPALVRLLRDNPAGTGGLLYHAARRVVSRRQHGRDRAEALAMVSDFMVQTISSVRGEDSFLGRLGTRSDVSRDEAGGIAAQVLIAGTVVPASMLGLAIKLLLTTPHRLQPFTRNAETSAKATEEIFRYLSFESQPRIRVATEDVEVGGVLIRAGQLVAVALETANRDARVFECPNDLDFDRDSAQHLAFGWGPHQCLGQNLARLEVRKALETIAERVPDLRLQHSDSSCVQDDSIVHTVPSLRVIWGAAT